MFQGSKITITTEGYRLGSVIGRYMVRESSKILRNCKDLTVNCSCCIYIWMQFFFTFFYFYLFFCLLFYLTNNFFYFMRTINCISSFISPIAKIKKNWYLLCLMVFQYRKKLESCYPSLVKLRGMGTIDPTKNANDEYNNSREMTSQLINSIKQQEHRHTVSDENKKLTFSKLRFSKF